MISLQLVVNSRAPAVRLTRLSSRLRDDRPELLHTVDELLKAESERFADGELIKTGRLMRSLTDRGGPDQVLVVGPHSLTFGTRVPYAAFHKKVRSGKPLVGLTNPEKAAVRTEYKRRLLEDL